MTGENGGCTYGKVTRTMLMGLKETFDKFVLNEVKEIKESMHSIEADVKRINKLMARPRPTWAMLIVITTLASFCTGLVLLVLRARI